MAKTKKEPKYTLTMGNTEYKPMYKKSIINKQRKWYPDGTTDNQIWKDLVSEEWVSKVKKGK